MCELQSKADGKNYYVEQEVMDLYRPSREDSDTWRMLLFNELLTYYLSPKLYTKAIHELKKRKDELS